MDTKHPDEGTIYAYVEGQLPAAAHSRVDAHVSECEECASLVVEARGLIAAASGIIGALDSVPANVVPRRRVRRLPPWLAAAAVVVLAVGVSSVAIRSGLDSRQELATASDAAAELGREAADVSPAVAAPQPIGAEGVAAAGVGTRSAASGAIEEGAARQRTAAEPPAQVARKSDPREERTAFSSATTPLVVAPAAPPMVAGNASGTGVGARIHTPATAPSTGRVAADLTAGASAAARGVVRREATAAPLGETAASAISRRTDSGTPRSLEDRPPPNLVEPPAPIRTTRYEASPGAIVELREFPAVERVPPAQPGVNEYRWGDAAGTRLYVLSGTLTVDELERLARQLGDLPVVR